MDLHDGHNPITEYLGFGERDVGSPVALHFTHLLPASQPDLASAVDLHSLK